MPARTIRGKSVGIDTLLDHEPGLFERNTARWWVGSCGTFEPGVVNKAHPVRNTSETIQKQLDP
jgi:hypothetical protein